MGTPAIYNLDHLGLVAGLIDEINLVSLVNEHVGDDRRDGLSTGLVVKAMLLNGLGLVSAPLYLFSRFFEGKATEQLLGEGIEPSMLNDDCLGRALDKIWRSSLNALFMRVSLSAVRHYDVEVSVAHLDSTSLSVEGAYRSAAGAAAAMVDSAASVGAFPASIHLCHGYSRDHRPDLKQFMMNLVCTGDHGIPLMLSMADGNQSDSQAFGPLMTRFAQQWTFEGVQVADAALYSAENLRQMGSLQWLTRVPLRLAAASSLLDDIHPSSFVASDIEGYQLSVVGNAYAGIHQQWVVVRSEQRQQHELEALDDKVAKAETQAFKALKSLCAQSFECPVLAQQAADALHRALPYHQLGDIEIVDVPHYGKGGRPPKGTQPIKLTHRLSAQVYPDTQVLERLQRRAGCFILATPVYDESDERTTVSAPQMLRDYKAQSVVERGFRFLKDPMFFADSVFLKSPHRIEALGCVMALCLLVYTLGERCLRQSLQKSGQTVPNQLGKGTQRPTLRWVFQCFQAVHVLVIDKEAQVVNLTAERQWILNFFPAACRVYYSTS